MPAISALPAGVSLDGSELLPMVQSSTTKKTTTALVAALVAAGVSGAGAAGSVAFFSTDNKVTSSNPPTDFAWDDATKILSLGATAKITTPEIDIGTTPFVFSEPSPGVAQLGDANLSFDSGSVSNVKQLAVGIALGGAVPGLRLPSVAGVSWDDGAGNTIGAFYRQDPLNGPYVELDGRLFIESQTGTDAFQTALDLDIRPVAGTHVTQIAGADWTIGSADASDVIDFAYGMFLEPLLHVGTVTNAFGLYIDDWSTAATNSYAIYTNAGKVHFGDAVDCSVSVSVDPTGAGFVDAAVYKVGGTAGLVSFSGAVTNITVVNGIVTAAS